MKIIHKIANILIIMFILFGLFSNTFASDTNTKLNIIQNASETKYLENDQGYISKTIVDSNAETGEVTVEVKVSNTAKETTTYADTEVMFVIDNSPSMDFKSADGEVRKDLVIKSAKNLASSIFKQSNNVKIGVVKFSGAYSWYWGASIDNATLVQSLSNDETTVLAGIQKIADSGTSSGTNIDAGLQRANNNFSKDCKNKIIVLFTDGVPNADVKGTAGSDDTTTKESLTVQANTKETIKNITNSGVYLISMMTGINVDSETYEAEMNAIENIFGTTSKPTAGKFYNISDTEIEKIVENDILTDIMEKVQNPLNTIKVVDYFPADITENFEFTYIGKPSIGEVSSTIDETTNAITWDIGTLKGNEVATLKYKLKIKDMSKQSPVYNKELATNEKILLTYKDREEKDYEVTLASSPKIKLVEVEESQTSGKTEEITKDRNEKQEGDSEQKDTTVANGILPNTGVSFIIIIAIMGVCIMAIVGLKGYRDNRDIK